LATGTPAGEVFASLEDGRAWKLEPDGWHPTQEAIAHRHRGLALRHRAGGFFQVSAPWAMDAFGAELEAWDVRGGTLFDLYGGVGLFSALLKDRFRRFVLVESEPHAVAWARKNLAEMGLPAECHAQDAADWIPEGLGEPGDVVLVDPPRVGLAPIFAEKLKTARAQTLVLVGCDGAAFCRDVKRLAPEWHLERLVALDLFPLTAHAEFLGLLRRQS
jgi:23S rRNA (uracil1939-C5)-methyltransferase